MAVGPKHERASGTSSNDWMLAFYLTAGGAVPAREFMLRTCPQPVLQMLLAILVAVRDAPPPSFAPSNMWHAMKDEMKGFHEARDEHDGVLYRLFCVVDRQATERGLDAPAVALICGGVKPIRTRMNPAVYEQALEYRVDYLATRRILLPLGIPASLDVRKP
jgi:hypothetical protein